MSEPDGIAGTNGIQDRMPHPAKPPRDRYTSIRNHLAKAHQIGKLTNDTYLLAQIALILCDVQECLELQNGYLHELAVHGGGK